MILATNHRIGEWGTTFEDTAVAVAILDRLLLQIDGDSYRMRTTARSWPNSAGGSLPICQSRNTLPPVMEARADSRLAAVLENAARGHYPTADGIAREALRSWQGQELGAGEEVSGRADTSSRSEASCAAACCPGLPGGYGDRRHLAGDKGRGVEPDETVERHRTGVGRDGTRNR